MQKIHSCGICDATFTTNGNRDRHIRTVHQGERRFKCNLCNKSYTSNQDLNVHIQGHFSERIHRPTKHKKIYKCDICTTTFTTSGYRNIHIRTLHQGQRFNCKLCNKSYTLNHNLALHIKQTHLGEGFKCHQQCSKSFRTKMELSLHLLSHTSEKPHKCDTCNATFKYKQALQRHIKSLHPSVKITM